MSLVKCTCIDDSNRPPEIPAEKWIVKDEEYRILGISVHLKQNKVQGVTLIEKPLDESCAPYKAFLMKRFCFRKEDLPALFSLLSTVPNSMK